MPRPPPARSPRGRRTVPGCLPRGLLAELDCNRIQSRMDMHTLMDMQTSGSSRTPDADAGIDRYWESTAPGEGRRMPRADAASDARVLGLNGVWRFRLAPTAAGTGHAFLADDFDDAGWDAMPVPSHWVLEA